MYMCMYNTIHGIFTPHSHSTIGISLYLQDLIEVPMCVTHSVQNTLANSESPKEDRKYRQIKSRLGLEKKLHMAKKDRQVVEKIFIPPKLRF